MAALPASLLRPAIAGLSGTFVGIGISRFAYTPLMPALIEAGWFEPGEAAYLGAANLAGYLLGAAATPWILARLSSRPFLRANLVILTIVFFACALNLGFAWYMAWRFVSGLCGGMVMVATAPTILQDVPPERRGLVGGIVFTGVGSGIALSGTVVPWLVTFGVERAWLGLGFCAALMTALSWTFWPDRKRPARMMATASPAQGLRLLAVPIAVYALIAAALVAHMVFLVDFVARGLGHGLATGSLFWVIFGLGAMAGPILAGRMGDWLGFRKALVIGALAVLLGAGLPLLNDGIMSLAASALLMGAMTPGSAPLVLGRMSEIAGGGRQQAAWGLATTGFALAQASCAWLLSIVYDRTGAYTPLFAIALAIGALAVTLSALDRRRDALEAEHGKARTQSPKG